MNNTYNSIASLLLELSQKEIDAIKEKQFGVRSERRKHNIKAAEALKKDKPLSQKESEQSYKKPRQTEDTYESEVEKGLRLSTRRVSGHERKLSREQAKLRAIRKKREEYQSKKSKAEEAKTKLASDPKAKKGSLRRKRREAVAAGRKARIDAYSSASEKTRQRLRDALKAHKEATEDKLLKPGEKGAGTARAKGDLAAKAQELKKARQAYREASPSEFPKMEKEAETRLSRRKKALESRRKRLSSAEKQLGHKLSASGGMTPIEIDKHGKVVSSKVKPKKTGVAAIKQAERDRKKRALQDLRSKEIAAAAKAKGGKSAELTAAYQSEMERERAKKDKEESWEE